MTKTVKMDSGTDPGDNGHKTNRCPACMQDVFTKTDATVWPPVAFVDHKTITGEACIGSGKPVVSGYYFSANPGTARAFGATMDPNLMTKLGFAEGAQPTAAEKCAAYSKHAMGEASDDEIKAMAADLEKHEEPEAKAMAAKFKRMSAEPVAEEKKPEEDKAEAEAMNALKMSLTAKGVTIPANATRAHLMSLSALHVGAKEDDAAFNARVDQRIAEREAAKAKAEREQEGAQLVTMARTAKAPDHEIAALNALVAAGDMPNARAAAQKYAAAAGNAHLMSRVTAGSHPIGKAPMPVTTFAADSPDDIETQIASKAKEHVEAEAKAGRKVLMSAAMEHVLRADKTLAAQYKSIRR
jgi:hypothetical protein